ncbi:GL16496 [Drosophila persimilis]|uniref:GL16496 n=1 Tax=Drosophila persimilis TaxID=7234 RepID=B4GW86_DROPE|nr:GL16496 [Drosophila persimilis]
MDAEHLKRLEGREAEYIPDILNEFNKKHADLLVFDSFHSDNQWHELWLAIFGILDDAQLGHLHTQCLNTVRILTRDEFSLQTNYIEHEVSQLLRLARVEASSLKLPATPDELKQQEEGQLQLQEQPSLAQSDIIAEALKCLCNLVYQSADCRRQCLRQHCLDAILKRVASSMRHPCALEYYDMKLLFFAHSSGASGSQPSPNRSQRSHLHDQSGWMTSWPSPAAAREQLIIICELAQSDV